MNEQVVRIPKPLCSICKKDEFKYTCPRCNIQYCCLECYKSTAHSSCSESFYRDCFVREMKERKVSPAEQDRILAMLQKVEDENPVNDFLEETCSVPLEERLDGLNIDSLNEKDSDKIWDVLTLEEREEFMAAVEHGKICETSGKLLNEAWEPWWCKPKTLVKDISDDTNSRPNIPQSISVPKLSTLLPKGKDPSPLVAFNLVNTLYPYVLFQRIFNGCGASEFAESFCDCCECSSLYLHCNKTFSDCEEAIVSAKAVSVDVCSKEDIQVNEETLTEAIKDVGQILTGPNENETQKYVCASLSELHHVFSSCRSALKKDKNSKPGNEETSAKRKQLFAVMKKIEFLVSWSWEQSFGFPLLAIEVLEIYKKKMGELNVHLELSKTAPSQNSKVEKSKKPMIEELT